MVVSPTSTQEPGFAAAFPGASSILPPNSTPPQPPPSPPGSSYTTGGSASEAIQPLTIVAIVVGLVGFVVLILLGSFISRHPYFRQLKGAPPPSPQPGTRINLRGGLRNHNTNGYRPRPRPFPHVEPMIVMHTFTGQGLQPYDYDPSFLPPYPGPIPPPYSETLPHPPQQPCAPPRAVVEA